MNVQPHARSRSRLQVRALVVLTLVTSLIGIGAGTALAKPMGCPPDPAFSYSNVAASHIAGVSYAQGGPGETIGSSLTAGITVTAQMTGSYSGGVSVVVANAQYQVSASLAVALTAAVTYSDTFPIPLTVHQGYLDAGASSDHMAWSHGSYNQGCVWIVNGSGYLNAPYHLPAFWHWTS